MRYIIAPPRYPVADFHHNIVIIGDDHALGVGDWVTPGEHSGAVGRLRALVDPTRANARGVAKHSWGAINRGVAKSTTTEWVPGVGKCAIVADLIAAVGETVPFQALLGPGPDNPAPSDPPAAADWAARWTPHMSLTRAGPAVKRFQMRMVVDAMAARIATAAPAPFTVQLGALALRCNADRTRVFLCLDAVAGTPKLRAIHRAVDAGLRAFRQSAASGALRADEEPPTDEHAFHVSIAWAPIDSDVEEVVPREALDAIAKRHASGLWAHLLAVDCVEVSVGHVEHTIWLGVKRRQ
ncbi:hypothetical protein AMAG_18275 [Allomyces macrogynus ATCC 38327]|uniref:U6 snRNA phosphodiesterase n=1 Tax=Allomyces macrogynus (strain ATCC 38327) TaxID=578462 RepID=A0A0L0S7V6_ALLM3|nr:hypothetical protein AMAG_18275 [Allomyces macrogynus ATCC 38327]|eukprot:KNE58577.1 hypothetical protein AMAG_18275 [Allomyces macrogynus ATCC 38327]